MYRSTRGSNDILSAAEAIKRGIAADGGLFVPTVMPKIDDKWLAKLVNLDYKERAFEVLGLFLTDYSEEELKNCIVAAYTTEKFDDAAIAPVAAIDHNTFVLELWHGPTSAFKDMALQILPHLMSKALRKTQEDSEIVILTATSGDTGKAALEGFANVDQIKIIVFYPEEGVSPIQRLQMITQQGGNVSVVAVRGNFDDTQTGVKDIFNDPFFNENLAANGFQLSSANSINWGRLAPQIVYYFSAYADLLAKGCLQLGEAVNFVVPTGNFGNLLAGYYAKTMGLPIGKLICASNSNNVLTEFLNQGIYNKLRTFHKTLSPSMDILISSNLERLLYHITNADTVQIKNWMEELNCSGQYCVDERYLESIKDIFWADWVDDVETVEKITEVFKKYQYVADPHTAVAWQVGERYRQQTGDMALQVIVSTASPFKFNESVLDAIRDSKDSNINDEFSMLYELSQVSGWPVPPALAALEKAPVCHSIVCDKEEMSLVIKDILEKNKS
ncbi:MULTISPECIES: threonine synthase [Pelosinus]|uniref:Threonine synthase n=1 Tax=Pelosinus fermentans B4 TaxID=1149862 RepID=I9LA33_9FIRM|nr:MULTISPECIES: threonine synthase [Pelosinus]EIW17269.1 threonine synthase [Pelosinus fermentans B4]EIW23232.1 threonine synthase [Pelosinus fermentans A11]OAM94027.1 threonine synthase [Pelosinus fermentans DSM 17108]SDQ97584.1 threonine synthase [Pelosinus fermentans]